MQVRVCSPSRVGARLEKILQRFETTVDRLFVETRSKPFHLCIRAFGPSFCSPDEQHWWDRHQPYAEAWLESRVRQGEPHWEEAEHAVSTLLTTPVMRGWGRMPDEPERPWLSWEDIDAYEILFEFVIHGGVFGWYNVPAYLEAMRSFAAYLGERGLIARREHEQLQAEWDIWAARLIQVSKERGWYDRDGTRYTEEELREKNAAAVAMPMERHESKRKRTRRRSRRRIQKRSRRRNRR